MTPGAARFFASLFPRRWRERYEEEYRQFLQDHPFSILAVLNILKEALAQHAGNVDGDIRQAIRSLSANPMFTVVAVLMLAAGIGLNVAVYSVANAALFKGFRSIGENDRILYIGTEKNGMGCCVSYPDFKDWQAQSRTFDGLAAVANLGMTLTDDRGFVETNGGTEISANAFRLLGQTPFIGRDFDSEDESADAPPVTILSYSFWESRYGKDPRILGQALRINGVATSVVGVMPSHFSFPQNQDLWVLLRPAPNRQARDDRTLWFVFGRLANGETAETARAEMQKIGHTLAEAHPATNQGWMPEPLSFAEFFVSKDAPTIYKALWVAVAFVLLIACANLANLTLARAIGRSREIAVRIALGASRWRIVRQSLVESLMLSAMGALGGWWIAKFGLRIYELMATPPTQTWSEHLMDYSIDYRVFAYFIAITIGTGLLFGIAPAARLSKLNINSVLKEGGHRLSGGVRGKHLSALLVTLEIALAVVLLAGAGVMLRSFSNLYTLDLGIDPANRLTASFSLPASRFPTMEARNRFVETLLERLKSIAGVDSVTVANEFPTNFSSRLPFDDLKDPTVSTLVIGTGYFRTVGAQMIAGRDFNDSDKLPGSLSTVVNQRFAETYWPGENPVGKTLRLPYGRTEVTLTVIGVAANILQNDAFRTRQEFDPLVYLPYWKMPSSYVAVIARTHVAAGTLANTFRHSIYELDPELLVIDVSTMQDRLAGYGYYWNTAINSALFLIFAATALSLAAIGLYSVIAHSVGQRIHEIGIRLAIGGTSSDIMKLVFRQAMIPVGAGLGIGLAASFVFNPVLQSMLVKVSPDDPFTLAATSFVLIISAVLGCWIATNRVTRVDPVTALKQD